MKERNRLLSVGLVKLTSSIVYWLCISLDGGIVVVVVMAVKVATDPCVCQQISYCWLCPLMGTALEEGYFLLLCMPEIFVSCRG